jgi:cell division initiation protein
MKITALEIKQHEFEKSFRGYNIEEVDIFLNNLASEWERISNESKMLRMQLEIAEKEAAKLREVEMSLIKTLQNAEITSNKITEIAQNDADKKVENATLEAQRIVEKSTIEAQKIQENAKKMADEVISNAESKVSENQKVLQSKEAELVAEIEDLENHKIELINQLTTLSSNILAKLNGLSPSLNSPSIVAPIIMESIVSDSEELIEEEEESTGIASSANTMVLVNEEAEIISESEDLTIIEGIGRKISELLQANHIITFRELATTPSFRIKEILGYAGSSYSMHDPSTWAEQAILADSGKWEELDALKKKLIGGKEVEEKVMQVEVVESQEQVTEEMLDRVNKVKAALKKAMMDKEALIISEAAPKVKTINDIAAEKAAESGGSFFDSLG